uniref:EF-hand domain-containing protein n=1 Tax=Bicosoecida sp. CB-2014 TaxID=1486930 RepID=A0A7S1CQ67_9STRA
MASDAAGGAEEAPVDTSLIDACVAASVPRVKEALARGVDVNAAATIVIDAHAARPTTAVFEAAVCGDVAVLDALLSGAGPELDVNRRVGRLRHSPLGAVAAGGDEAAVAALLAHPSIDPNVGSDGLGAPLALACAAGRVGVVQQLLAHRGEITVDVNSLSRSGFPPIAEAVKGGHEKIVLLLLEDERVDADKESEGADGPSTALSLAVLADARDTVAALIDSGRVDLAAGEAKFGLLAAARDRGFEAMFELLERYFLTRAPLEELDPTAQVAKLRYAFADADVERRGYITKDQLGDLAAAVGTELEQAEIDEAAIALDTSGDKKIQFEELAAFWLGA